MISTALINRTLPPEQQIRRVYVNCVHVPGAFAIADRTEVHAYATDADGRVLLDDDRDVKRVVRRGHVSWLTRGDIAAGRQPHQ